MTAVTTALTGGQQASGVTGTTAVQEAGDETLTDFDEFLTLLTAQLENQDPLNPADGTEFVEQLATFTSVEQQVSTNDKLDTLISLQTSDSLLQAGAWVGRDINADVAGVRFSGDELTIRVPQEPGAERIEVVIRDAAGLEIARLDGVDSDGEITWDGQRAAGGLAPDGLYGVEIDYVRDTPQGEAVETRMLGASGEVVEVRLEGGAPLLSLRDGLVVRPNDVTSVGATTAGSQIVEEIASAL